MHLAFEKLPYVFGCAGSPGAGGAPWLRQSEDSSFWALWELLGAFGFSFHGAQALGTKRFSEKLQRVGS